MDCLTDWRTYAVVLLLAVGAGVLFLGWHCFQDMRMQSVAVEVNKYGGSMPIRLEVNDKLTAQQNMLISDVLVKRLAESRMTHDQIEREVDCFIVACKRINDETSVDALIEINRNFVNRTEDAVNRF